jgi:glycosyltransferase involved in cell wall biosynthesis
MEQLIAGQRWGLHCAEFEHYGLAPLELQRLGCVTFVHDSGGQAEAVIDAGLKYRDVDDAVRKMDVVMKSPARGAQLFAALPDVTAGHEVAAHREAFIAVLRSTGVLNG